MYETRRYPYKAPWHCHALRLFSPVCPGHIGRVATGVTGHHLDGNSGGVEIHSSLQTEQTPQVLEGNNKSEMLSLSLL